MISFEMQQEIKNELPLLKNTLENQGMVENLVHKNHIVYQN